MNWQKAEKWRKFYVKILNMKILFSHPNVLEHEMELIDKEMESGNWDVFHLRKPDLSEKELHELYEKLSDEVRVKTVLHHRFKGSCHSFEEVENLEGKIEYCFLSPVYDSISKRGYQSNFDKEELKEFLKKDRSIKVIGLGGVTEENYMELLEMGFDGGAFLGSVWRKYNEQLVINNE